MTRYATLKEDMKFFELIKGSKGWYSLNQVVIPANTIVGVDSRPDFGSIPRIDYVLTCGSLSLNITKEQAPDLLDFLE